MAYLVLVAGFITFLMFNTRLAFALMAVAIFLMYRSRTKGASEIARRRVQDDEPAPRMKAWEDPWGTGKKSS